MKTYNAFISLLCCIIVLLVCPSCGSKDSTGGKKTYIQIYYENSAIDSELDCEYDFNKLEQFNNGEIYDLGKIILEDSLYNEIKRHISSLKKDYDPKYDSIDYNIPLHFQAHFHEGDSLLYKVCIDGFNRISIDGNVVNKNDTLVYLLRRYAMLYDYSPIEELDYFDELSTFGLPDNYVNISRDSSLLFTLYNKVRLDVR